MHWNLLAAVIPFLPMILGTTALAVGGLDAPICTIITDPSRTFEHSYFRRPVVVRLVSQALRKQFRAGSSRRTLSWSPVGSWVHADQSLEQALKVMTDMRTLALAKLEAHGSRRDKVWNEFEIFFFDHMDAMEEYILLNHPAFHPSWRRYRESLRHDIERDRFRLKDNLLEFLISARGVVDSYMMQLEGLLHLPHIQAFQLSLERLPEENEFTGPARSLIYQLSAMLHGRLEAVMANPGKFYQKYRSYSYHLYNVPPQVSRLDYLEKWIRNKTFDFLIQHEEQLYFVKARVFPHVLNMEYYQKRKVGLGGRKGKSFQDQLDELSCFRGLLAYDDISQTRRFEIATFLKGEVSEEVKDKIGARQMLFLDPQDYTDKIEI
jgi:hypothetical protein